MTALRGERGVDVLSAPAGRRVMTAAAERRVSPRSDEVVGGVILDVPDAIRMRPTACTGRGGAVLVGRTYLLGGTPVVVITAYGPGRIRNVRIQFPDGTTTIRPFRGLRRPS